MAKTFLVIWNLDMFLWMSTFQNSLMHTDFNMFVDEVTSADENLSISTHFRSKATQQYIVEYIYHLFMIARVGPSSDSSLSDADCLLPILQTF